MRRNKKPVVMEAVESRLLMATIDVLNTNDSGAGSLRAAVASATNGDTISLVGVTGTITLGSAIAIDKGLTLTGPGKDDLSISGGGTTRIFAMTANLTLSDVTLTNGFSSTEGGAIDQGLNALSLTRVNVTNNTADSAGAITSNGWNATTTLVDCTFSNNTATNGTGGAILSSDSVFSATGCTFENNSAHSDAFVDTLFGGTYGGWAAGGGAALWQGNNTLTNCTFTGNSVSADDGDPGSEGRATGGAVFYVNSGGTTLLNCTITGNTATASDSTGGGVHLENGTNSISNCLIADNSTSSINEPDLHAGGNVTNGGYNLIGAMPTNGTFVDGANHDQVGTIASPIDAKLAALADNGGETMTVGLLSGSPAINAGNDATAPTTDQRGNARIGQSDIGAFEGVLITNHAPAFSSTPIDLVGAGTAWSYDITTTDADNADTHTITAVSKPTWLTLTDNGDGTATLGGTPQDIDYGPVSVTLRVSDGTDTTDQTFTLNVSVPKAVMWNNGILHVNGTDSADDLHIWIREKNQVRVTINGAIRNFDLADVQQVSVFGFDGDDNVLINVSTLASTVQGMDGNDTLEGGYGADWFEGGEGNDSLVGNQSNDNLVAGNGNDTLNGGTGNDSLFGEAGTDTLYDRDGYADLLNGGASNDSAQSDDSTLDSLTSIETTLS